MLDEENFPDKNKAVKKNLEPLSIDELENYIDDLKNEITRVEQEITKKKAHREAASQVFK